MSSNTRPEIAGPATVTLVGWMPETVESPSLEVENATPVWAPLKPSVAWLETIDPVASGELMVTRKRTLVDAAGASVPPLVAFAPVPRRATTRRGPDWYSA